MFDLQKMCIYSYEKWFCITSWHKFQVNVFWKKKCHAKNDSLKDGVSTVSNSNTNASFTVTYLESILRS